MERFAAEPTAGAHALFLEHTALCMNDRQALMANGRLIDEVTRAGLTEVLDQFQARLHATEHGIYEVRRVARRRGSAGAATTARSVRLLKRGNRDDMLAVLRSMPGVAHTGEDGVTRNVVRSRGRAAMYRQHRILHTGK